MKISDIYTKKTIQGTQTWRDITIYNGKTYPVRVLESNEGDELLIAGDELFNDIHPGEWGSENDGYDPADSKAAEAVDCEIFFFTDDTTLNYNDVDLRKDMADENPEWFD